MGIKDRAARLAMGGRRLSWRTFAVLALTISAAACGGGGSASTGGVEPAAPDDAVVRDAGQPADESGSVESGSVDSGSVESGYDAGYESSEDGVGVEDDGSDTLDPGTSETGVPEEQSAYEETSEYLEQQITEYEYDVDNESILNDNADLNSSRIDNSSGW